MQIKPAKDNNWFTPAKYIEAARAVMNGIDLDPASCEQANRTVKATRYYTKEDNGLMQPLYGRIWCNPPYGRIGGDHPTKSYQSLFADHLLRHRDVIDQAILLLLGNACFQKWFEPLWEYPLCFHHGKIEFERISGKSDSFGFGTTFVYIGPNEQKFVDVFSQFGRIVKAIDTPQPKPVTLDLWQSAGQE